MASPAEETTPSQPVLFRSSKKRKANYRRQRAEDDQDAQETVLTPVEKVPADPSLQPSTAQNQQLLELEATSTSQAVDQLLAEINPSSAQPEEGDEAERSITEALRLRAQRKSRLKGVGFRANSSTPGAEGHGDHNDNQEWSLVPCVVTAQPDGGSDTVVTGGMTSRFAPQTGIVGEVVNKHMMEYIESHLSNRKTSASPSPGLVTQPSAATATVTMRHASNNPAPGTAQHPTGIVTHGKLMEVDLGEEARERNVALTERARQRLAGSSGAFAASSGSAATPGGLAADNDDDDPLHPRKKQKVRLGRDGKPWRPRNRRTSDDIARDRLVEEIMRENKLDVYDVSSPHSTGANPGSSSGAGGASGLGPGDADGDADERLAEEFRREFLDAVSLRQQQQAAAKAQQRKKAATAAGNAAAKVNEEILRGPKLGGSRSQRAAMRDVLLAKEREKAAKEKQGRR